VIGADKRCFRVPECVPNYYEPSKVFTILPSFQLARLVPERFANQPEEFAISVVLSPWTTTFAILGASQLWDQLKRVTCFLVMKIRRTGQ